MRHAHRLLAPALPAVLLSTLLPGAARADWADGRYPEGDNAFTVERNQVRLSILGRSAVGLTDRLELSSYLPFDLLLFPNLQLKYRFFDGAHGAAALELGAGGGLYPIPAAAILPVGPGGVVGGAALILVALAEESATLHASVALGPQVMASARGGLFAYQAAAGAIGVGGAAGGRGGGVFPFGVAAGGAHGGASGGLELDAVLDPRTALYLEGDIAGIRGGTSELVLGQAGLAHAWAHVHLQAGAYSLLWLPYQQASQRVPIGPYVNFYWVLGG